MLVILLDDSIKISRLRIAIPFKILKKNVKELGKETF